MAKMKKEWVLQLSTTDGTTLTVEGRSQTRDLAVGDTLIDSEIKITDVLDFVGGKARVRLSNGEKAKVERVLTLRHIA